MLEAEVPVFPERYPPAEYPERAPVEEGLEPGSLELPQAPDGEAHPDRSPGGAERLDRESLGSGYRSGLPDQEELLSELLGRESGSEVGGIPDPLCQLLQLGELAEPLDG